MHKTDAWWSLLLGMQRSSWTPFMKFHAPFFIFHFLRLFSPRIFYYTCIHYDMHTYSCVPLESLLLVLSPFVTLLVIKCECTFSPILTHIIQEDSNNKQKGSKGRETEERPPVLGQT